MRKLHNLQGDRRRFYRRACTLIELLVLIAIIAILAAILYPEFARAKESKNKRVNVHSISQISSAIEAELLAGVLDLAVIDRQIQQLMAEVLRELRENWIVQHKPSPLFTAKYQVEFTYA